MRWDRIAKRWRKSLVKKLQERYGLAEEEARKKTDAWLQWISKEPSQQPRTLARQGSPIHSGKLRSRATGRSS